MLLPESGQWSASMDKFLSQFRINAEQGHPDAQYNLGVCCRHGLGVSQDLHSAFEWLLKSADGGLIEAKKLLDSDSELKMMLHQVLSRVKMEVSSD